MLLATYQRLYVHVQSCLSGLCNLHAYWQCIILTPAYVPGPAGLLSLTLEGRDAFSNVCSIDPAQVQVTCQPEGALQHVEVQADLESVSGAVYICASATAQGGILQSSTISALNMHTFLAAQH